MSRKVTKLLSVILTVVMLLTMVTPVFAAEITPELIKPDHSGDGATTIQNVGVKIMNIVNAVGVVIAVVILSVLGIKYMMGSASEKAEYKKTMIPYIVGAIFIFAAPTLANVVYKFALGLNA